ncbi:coiled-coil domain-containing protein 60 isoform X1 [Sarcophilus harrisii]|uniref:coiled-coil domain-containing protein 60 isoform X1 n=1 Tax=Sarcophilus harrisii TaxID=9305 RepID=UPI0002271C13|nr:coiled-coil domain-containing protein 60 isoform X1 [Sarcophilus harrisii]
MPVNKSLYSHLSEGLKPYRGSRQLSQITKNESFAISPKDVEKAKTKITDGSSAPGQSFRYMEKEITNLKKDLLHSRYLIRSVKMGQSYFDILKAESAIRKKILMDKKREEEERNRFQPPKLPAAETSDVSLNLYDGGKREGTPDVILRPFNPVHNCLISPSLSHAQIEPLFRQLCALHWLLEALTIDHNHHGMKPLITCWNEKDPGGSKSTLKKINKEKVMLHKWEHFVMPPKSKKYKMPGPRIMTGRKASRKASTISLTRTSGGSSPQSSMLSVNPPGSDEPQSTVTLGTSSKELDDNESSSTKADDDNIPISLQKLMEMVREDARRTVSADEDNYKKYASTVSILKPSLKSDMALKETAQKTSGRSGKSFNPVSVGLTLSNQASSVITEKSSSSSTDSLRRPKSYPGGVSEAKSNVCANMRAKFFSIAQEAGFCLQDRLEILTKRQEERGIQKFFAFTVVSNFHDDIEKMRHPITITRGDAEELANHWYFDLLSKLPEDLKKYRPAKKILQKLQKHGENLDLRIRPHVLLKVLQDLRTWEICSPDIAVAIEFVREHIVQMPQGDYIKWLRARVNLPMRSFSAPPP